MNIFAVDRNPERAAQALCDQHVRKMILETAQILSAVASACGAPSHLFNPHADARFYKASTHVLGHPCTKWALRGQANWRWLCAHGIALSAEYEYRFGKSHASSLVVQYAAEHPEWSPPVFKRGFLTRFAQAFGAFEDLRTLDPILAYRRYYVIAKPQTFKRGPPKWTRREPPPWYTSGSEHLRSRKAQVSRRLDSLLLGG